MAATGRRLPFLVEYDTGTESLDRLAAKLSGYARLTAAAGHPTWLLFAFTSIRRESHARTVLQHPAAQLRLPIATAALTPPGTAHTHRRTLAAWRAGPPRPRHQAKRPRRRSRRRMPRARYGGRCSSWSDANSVNCQTPTGPPAARNRPPPPRSRI